jgi:uncharacterized protein YndB with AHSA1/START domain
MNLDFLYAVEREFEAPIDEVWDAWVDPEKLESWYHPTDLSNVEGLTTSIADIGGEWSIAVSVPAHNFVAYFYGIYLEVDFHQKLEHTMLYTESLEQFQLKDLNQDFHKVLVEFQEDGRKTWVKFSQFGELPEGQADQAKAGMESYFDSLANFLSRSQTEPA